MWFVLLLACIPDNPGSPEQDGPFHDGDPHLSDLQWECDSEAQAWVVRVRTDGWTQNGYVWMARDLDTIEKHRITSQTAAADGSWDCLELNLDIVADWRDAVSGSSTRWRCTDAPDLSFQVLVTTPKDGASADCATWGETPSLWGGTDDVPDCDTVWDFPTDSADPGAGEDTGLVLGEGSVDPC